MLAATAHGVGVGSGWLTGGGRVAARALLGIPEGRLARTVIALGYPDEAARRARQHPAQARKSPAEIVHLERYGGIGGAGG